MVQGPFREAGERIVEITGTPVTVRSLEDVFQEAAQDFDAFHAERTPPTSTAASSILVAAGSPNLGEGSGTVSESGTLSCNSSSLRSDG